MSAPSLSPIFSHFSWRISIFFSTNRHYSDLVGAHLFKHVVLKVDPARLGEFLSLIDANPRLAEYCRTLELWLDRFAVWAPEVDAAQSQIIRRLPRVQKLILNSAVTALRSKDGSVQAVTRSRIGWPLNETLAAMCAATWITGLVLAPCFDHYWTHQVFKAFAFHITHLTLSVKEPSSLLLTMFPKCPQLRHVELPYPVLRDAAEISPVLVQSPNLRHLSISHLNAATTESRDPNTTKHPISHEPLDSLDLAYISDAKFFRIFVASIPTRALTVLFESENHAVDLRNITGALFSDSLLRRKSEHLKVLHLERSGRKVERSTIEERNIALETLRDYCVRSNVELKYNFPVSSLCFRFLGG